MSKQISKLDAALDYAARGWLVFPIKPGGKAPATKNGFHNATTDPEQIRKWWSKPEWQDRNIGVVTSSVSGVCVLDCDVDKETGEFGEDSLAALEKANGALPIHPVSHTPTGGTHHLFRWPGDGGDFPRRIRIEPGLDVLGSRLEGGVEKAGYFIVPPSSRGDQGDYSWVLSPKTVDLPLPPSWLIKKVRDAAPARDDRPVYEPIRSNKTSAYGRKVLDENCREIASCPPGNQDETLIRRATRIGSIMHGGEIDPQEAMNETVNAALQMVNAPGRDKWTYDTVQKKIARAFRHAASDPNRTETRRKVVNGPDTVVYTEPEPETQAAAPKLSVVSDNPEPKNWRDGLPWVLNAEGTAIAKNSIRNAQLYIEHHPAVVGMFQYNNFTDRVMMMYGLPDDTRNDYPRELADHDEVALAAFLNNLGQSGRISETGSVIREVAFRNQYDPLKDYLDGLVWDGDARLQEWLIRYAEADDTEYVRLVSEKFLISAAARALRPACKVDTMLVLEGRQSIGKSSLCRVLAGEWFTDQVGDVTSKDSSERLQGAWVIEIPEMDKFSRAEANAVKDFLSRTEDRYRPAYGRNVIKRPRRCVFLGTINPDGVGYLRDTTGNRRFWPVRVEDVDLRGLTAVRDQLWAEAVHRLKDGAEWWLDRADEGMARVEQELRRDEDVWEPAVEKWLKESIQECFTTADVLFGALALTHQMQKQPEKIRVSRILKMLGAVPVMHKNGIKGRSWEIDKKELFGRK
jgi:predicted P-loop ATPase